MRRSPIVHLVAGSFVIALAAVGGQISRLPSLQPHRSVATDRAAPTWALSASAHSPARVIVKARRSELLPRLVTELLSPGPGGFAVPPSAVPVGGVTTFASMPGLGVITLASASDAETVLARLRSDPRIEYAELDALWHVDTIPASRPNDARYGEQWGLENTGQAVGAQPAGIPGVDIDARTAWGISHGSDDVIVAVIDSGVDVGHEDLRDNIWTNDKEVPGNGIDDDGNGVVDDVHGFNAIDRSGTVMDDVGHGTHVAGIIGAVGGNGVGVTGVNWKTRIMPLKFLGPEGGGTTSDAIACIDYCVAMKERGENIRVVNCSWGSTENSRALQDAMDAAIGTGMTFICAAGNDGVDTDQVPHYPSCFRSDGVISVAALTPDDNLARFSNFGAESVDIAAPGIEILSTLPGGQYGFASGTSMAAPFVSGVAALVAGGAPNLTEHAMRERLLDHATAVQWFDGKLASASRLSGSGALTAEAGH